jgi:transcriptional regulator with XRE-family HTH domain
MTDPEAAMLAVREQVAKRRALPPPAMRRALRQAAGLTGGDLAGVMHVTRQAISKWERGERHPTGAYLDAYLAVLDELRRAADGEVAS